MKKKLYYLWLDFIEFLGNIEMRVKYFLNKKYYSSLSENDIPKDTFYCYSGCRCQSNNGCPYMDYSVIADSSYCHYVKEGLYDALLNDECKICGISEYISEYESVEEYWDSVRNDCANSVKYVLENNKISECEGNDDMENN